MASAFSFVADEIILRIFHKLPALHLFAVARVCKRWETIANDKSLPYQLLLNKTVIVVLGGYSGAGKTTLLAKLLQRKSCKTFKSGGDKFSDLELRKVSTGKVGHLNELLDTSDAEKKEKRTLHLRFKNFQTMPYVSYTFIDSSGGIPLAHQFVRSSYVADCAILVVSEILKKFEVCCRNFSPLFDQCITLAATGVKLIIFAVAERSILEDMPGILQKMKKLAPDCEIVCVPINLNSGANIFPDCSDRSSELTILGALERYAQTTSVTMRMNRKLYARTNSDVFVLPICKVFGKRKKRRAPPTKKFAIMVGKVSRGVLREGEKVVVLTQNRAKPYLVGSIENGCIRTQGRIIKAARPGNWVSLKIRFSEGVQLDSGDVVVNASALNGEFADWNAKNYPRRVPKIAENLRCKLVVQYSGARRLRSGAILVLHCGAQEIAVTLRWIEGLATAKAKAVPFPRELKAGCVGIAELSPLHNHFIAEVWQPKIGKKKLLTSDLGRLILRDNNKTEAIGLVVDLTPI